MKTIKNHRIVFITLTIILSALLAAACISPFDEEILQIHQENSVTAPQANLPEGKGAILLKFGGNSRLTIMPDIDYEQLVLSVAISKDGSIIFQDTGISMSQKELENFPIILDIGVYSILVLGYYENDIASYEGKAEVKVIEKKTESIPISLKGIVKSDVLGTFTYNITSPDTTPDFATMTITPISDDVITPASIPLILVANTYASSTGIDLKPGYYMIAITYGKAGFRTSTVRWVLHIYPAMESHFEYPLPLPALAQNNYTITFNANGGTLTGSATTLVAPGGKITEPSAPVHSVAYNFDGWYEETPAALWDFGTDLVWSDIILYAKWVDKEQFTVTFNKNTIPATDTVTNLPAPIPVYAGEKITEPAPKPTRTGYTFGGWYKESTLDNAWDFADPVTGNMTLYAKWTKIKVTVTFDVNSEDPVIGVSPAPVTVDYGTILGLPPLQSMLRTGYIFSGYWYEEAECLNRWSFSAREVTGNITLYARWDKADEEVIWEEDPEFDVGGGAKVFIIGESLEKIMNAPKGSYLYVDLRFVEDFDKREPGDNWILGPVDFGFVHPNDNTLAEFPEEDKYIKIYGSDIMLEEGVNLFYVDDIARIRIDIDDIQKKWGDYYFDSPEYNPMDTLVIEVHHIRKMEYTGKIYYHPGTPGGGS
jgi:uncharacterized repeat protein (TIGR02543 family)